MFDKQFFLQIQGAPMGAKFSLSLANLYMSWWEEKHIYPSNSIVWCGRYIDDLLLIWNQDTSSIQTFYSYL